MNKYLLLSAAATMAATVGGTGAAQASTTVHLGTAGTGTYCDYFVITKGTSPLNAAKHIGATGCGTTVNNDAGLKLKGKKVTGGKGGQYVFADTVLQQIFGTHDGSLWPFSSPLAPDATGATWAIVATTNGTTSFVLNSGPQTNRLHPGKALHKSAIADAIKALRQ